MSSSDRQRVLRIALPVLATVAIVAPLAWLWQASRVPAVYSVMDMGNPDYGGGRMPDPSTGGLSGHGQGDLHRDHWGCRDWSRTWLPIRHDQPMYGLTW
jgi:hypothetical protein